MDHVKYAEVARGNVFEHVTEGIIVHGCNSLGIMGSGFAKEVKERFPKAFEEYEYYCNINSGDPASLLGTVVWVPVTPSLYIANAITQLKFGTGKRQVNYEAVYNAFENVAEKVKNTFNGEMHVHYPMIGAGLGGGNWDIINEIIFHNLKGIPNTLWVLP